jgi:hypothetical protein
LTKHSWACVSIGGCRNRLPLLRLHEAQHVKVVVAERAVVLAGALHVDRDLDCTLATASVARLHTQRCAIFAAVARGNGIALGVACFGSLLRLHEAQHVKVVVAERAVVLAGALHVDRDLDCTAGVGDANVAAATAAAAAVGTAAAAAGLHA